MMESVSEEKNKISALFATNCILLNPSSALHFNHLKTILVASAASVDQNQNCKSGHAP